METTGLFSHIIFGGSFKMNKKLKEYQIDNIIFQVKKETKNILDFIKIIAATGVVVSLILWVLK